MTAHTPGPWKYDPAGYGNIRPVTETGKNICNFTRCHTSKELDEAVANARLIAAAPELLAALREMVAGFGFAVNNGVAAKLIERAQAAIAKVEGGAR